MKFETFESSCSGSESKTTGKGKIPPKKVGLSPARPF
jgi:hypothetical protein